MSPSTFCSTPPKTICSRRSTPRSSIRAKLPAKFVHEYGIANIVWSYNIAYNKDAFPDGKHPKNWAEFLDTAKFPGRRALRDRVNPMLEIALLADGVPFDKLYPLDVDRALKKLEPFRKSAVWWTTNSQSQQLMVDGECSLGILNNGRIYDVVQKGAKIGIEWNQNLQSVDYLVVPRGSQASRMPQWRLIAEMMVPESQARSQHHAARADQPRRLQVDQEGGGSLALDRARQRVAGFCRSMRSTGATTTRRWQNVGRPGSSREWQTRRPARRATDPAELHKPKGRSMNEGQRCTRLARGTGRPLPWRIFSLYPVGRAADAAASPRPSPGLQNFATLI